MEVESITEVPSAALASVVAGSGAKDEEVVAEKLLASLSALSGIRQGLRKIQLQQARDRHRLDLHSEANEGNYSSVALGSIYETIVFITVAIFQVPHRPYHNQ